jgi:hypothetical protein
MLQVKGSCRLSLPVLRDNLSRVVRGAGSVVHISSAEDAPDNNSELVSGSSLLELFECCCLASAV